MPRIGTPEPESARAIAALAQALGHPLRVQILNSLIREPNSAIGLTPILGVPLSSVSYHLNQVLDRRLGVVEAVETNLRRGAEETVYRVDADALLAGLVWPKVPDPVAAGLRGAALVALCEQALAALASGTMDARPDSTALWRPVLVDGKGWREIRAAMQETKEKVETAVRASVERAEGATIPAVIGLAAFEAAPLETSETAAASGEGPAETR